MKATTVLLSLFLVASIAGCATANYSVGRDFSSENVKQIVKGKTTSADLVRLFGEPFTKTVISETDEKWIYMHSSGSAHAQSYIVSMKVQTTGNQKTLDILLKNGVVANFSFTDGPGPYNAVVQ